MGNLLLRIFCVVAAFIAVILIIGSLMPRDYSVTSSTDINATPEQIFPLINELERWPGWSAWSSDRIPELEIKYSGNKAGEGSVQSWTEPRGKGKLWITASTEFESVEYESEFADFPVMNSRIELKTNGDTTTVSLSSQGSLPGGPFYGWFGRSFFAGELQNQYDQSLSRLKEMVESAKKPEKEED